MIFHKGFFMLMLIFFIGFAPFVDPGFSGEIETDWQARLSLNLEEAVKEALKNNPDLKIRREALRVDQARLDQAEGFFQDNPVISLEADYRRRRFASPSRKSGADFEISLQQAFEIGGQRKHRRAAAAARLEAGGWMLADAKRRLRQKVSHVFFDLLITQEKIRVQEQRLSVHDAILKAGEKRFQEEDISVLEIDTLRLDLDQARHDLEKWKAAKVETEKTMHILLGLTQVQTLFATEGGLSAFSELSDKLEKNLPSLKTMQACALSMRPDLKAAERALAAQQSALHLAKSEAHRNLSFGPLYRQDNEDTIIGATFNFSLPFFKRNRVGVAVAREGLKIKQIERDAKRSALRQTLAATYKRFQLAKKQLGRYEKNYFSYLKGRMRFPMTAYQAGEIGIFEFSMALDRLALAHFRFLDDLLKGLKAKADLDAQFAYCKPVE